MQLKGGPNKSRNHTGLYAVHNVSPTPHHNRTSLSPLPPFPPHSALQILHSHPSQPCAVPSWTLQSSSACIPSTEMKLGYSPQVLAAAGVASRRASEDLIFSGAVTVNGKRCLVPQTSVHPVQDQARDCTRARTETNKPLNVPCPGGLVTKQSPDRVLETDLKARFRILVVDVSSIALDVIYARGDSLHNWLGS